MSGGSLPFGNFFMELGGMGLISFGFLMPSGLPRLFCAILVSLMGLFVGRDFPSFVVLGAMSLMPLFLSFTLSGGVMFLILVIFFELSLMVWLISVLLMLVTLEM